MDSFSFKKKITVVVISLLFCTSSFAQKSDLGNWLIYLGNYKINNQWNWHNEVQHRNYNAIGDLEQLLLRTGLGYSFSEGKNNVLVGYGYILSKNYVSEKEKVSVNEHRIFQQFISRYQIKKLNIQHRFRLEERFVADDFKLRFRYFLSINIPLGSKEIQNNSWYLSAYNEIFIKDEGDLYDRNRLFGGIGYRLNSNTKLVLGYMNQFFKGSSRDQINLLVFISF